MKPLLKIQHLTLWDISLITKTTARYLWAKNLTSKRYSCGKTDLKQINATVIANECSKAVRILLLSRGC